MWIDVDHPSAARETYVSLAASHNILKLAPFLMGYVAQVCKLGTGALIRNATLSLDYIELCCFGRHVQPNQCL